LRAMAYATPTTMQSTKTATAEMTAARMPELLLLPEPWLSSPVDCASTAPGVGLSRGWFVLVLVGGGGASAGVPFDVGGDTGGGDGSGGDG